MFETVKLTRPDLTVDARHDGRHRLDPANPVDRESVPLLVNLPDEGIAFFTYTWVNSAGEAGAAVCLFGPGVGPEQLAFRIPDRKVPDTMDFPDWRIENFEMAHDLRFGAARFRFANDTVQLDFAFEGSHPPYAYGAHALGCPPYCATNRIEQSGHVKGELVLRGRRIRFDTTGHRDHSWGIRDWKAMQSYRWFEGQTGPDTSVHFWHLNALGGTRLLGYVLKNGLMAEITGAELDLQFDEHFRQRRLQASIVDEAGRTTELTTDFTAHGVLIPAAEITLNEAAGRMVLDGRTGVGWLEHAWPTDYLAHIRSIPRYTPGAGTLR